MNSSMKLSFEDDQGRVAKSLRDNFREIVSKQPEVLRRAVSVITTGQDYVIRIPSKEREQYLLACISWYLPEEVSVLLRVKLEEIAAVSEQKKRIRLSLLLSSEPEMILYILESSVLGRNPEEVFGNIRGMKIRFGIVPQRRRKPKRQVRHRGYRDKGSLGPESVTRQDYLKDINLRQLQDQIELERQITEESIQFSLGFIQ